MKNLFPLLIIGAMLATSCVSKKKFNELTAEKDALMSSVEKLESQVNDLSSTVSDLESSNMELEKEKKALDSNLSSMMDKLDTQEKEVAAMKENLEQKQYQLNNMWTEMESAFSDMNTAAAETESRIKTLENFLYLEFDDSVNFRSGSATVASEDNATLDKLADMLKRNEGIRLMVEGHADKRGIVTGNYKNNLELSVTRAQNVVNKLLARGVNPDQLMVAGSGSAVPIVDGSTSTELAPNRRAEFVILPNLGKIYKVYEARNK